MACEYRMRGRRLPWRLTAMGFALLFLALLPAVLIAAPRIFGISAMSVPTGSMEPAVRRGSLAYIVDDGMDGIADGDVAAFYSLDGQSVVLHRVIDIDFRDGLVRTKGDANGQADIMGVPHQNVIGRMVLAVPYMGYIADAACSVPGRAALFLLAASGMLLLVAAHVSGRRKMVNKII